VKYKKLLSTIVCFLCCLFFGEISLQATQNVTLAWNPSTDSTVAGYKIYYGSASGNYTNVVDVGNVTNATISGLVKVSLIILQLPAIIVLVFKVHFQMKSLIPYQICVLQ